ncbi:MAG TPA: type VI secretion system baseplate subunit TssG, partial [Pirellulaceae bacterium]|nr:type VI secretion system baseplate subunit TssG [Pirellulaceae bacterium]
MAGEKRPAPIVVAALERLRREPYKFEFYQAMRLLECAHPDQPRIGTSSHASEDRVRLGQEPSLVFAPSSIARFETTASGHDRLVVHFLGLLGPNGPLPLHLTEYVRDRVRNSRDHTLEAFLDIFHHRMLSLLYRATADTRPALSLDRPADDTFAIQVGSLIGLGLPALRDRDALPDRSKQFYASHLVRQARNREGLLAMIKDFLGLPVEIEEFVGHWLQLPDNALLCLGTDEGLGVLGESFTIGARVWDCQHMFRVIVGPMKLADFNRLLPQGASLPRLVALVRNYVGDEFDWDLQLILQKEEVPGFRLGEAGRLGYTTWINSKPAKKNPDDLALNPTRTHGSRRST